MKHSSILAFATLVAGFVCGAGAAGDGVVRNADDYRAFVADAARPACAFDVTGVVSVVRRDGFFVLADGRSRLPIRTTAAVAVAPGDRVRATGRLDHRSPDRKAPRTLWHSLLADRVEITGRGAAPAPVRASLAEIDRGLHSLERVVTEGTVDAISPDDVDPGFLVVVLRDGPHTVLVSLPSAAELSLDGRGLVDARVRVTGFCLFNLAGARKLTGWHVIADAPGDLRVLRPPDGADATRRRLVPQTRVAPEAVVALGRRLARGRVRATWNGDRFLLATDDGQLVPVELAAGETPVAAGCEVEVVGSAETDLFRVKLSNARVKSRIAPSASAAPHDDGAAIGPKDLFHREGGKTAFNADCFGRLFASEGIVKSVPTPGVPASRMVVDCAGTEVSVSVDGAAEAAAGVSAGARVRVSGIVVFEADNWRPSRPFPCITSLFVATRTPRDLVVTASAPWWTPPRIVAVVAALAVALLVILVWNVLLHRLADRRARELAEEIRTHVEAELKVGERTRLAIELHDSISQNLTGAAMELRSARRALGDGDAPARPMLDLAIRTIAASRDELRNCIWDLRNRALEAPDFETAIRQTIEPLALAAQLRIRFAVARELVTDTTAHAILSIVRELVVNAVRHGRAATVVIAGAVEDGWLRFSVRDDGCGFDPAGCPGQDQGHFGLQGVRERAKSFGGDVTIQSRPGAGTKVTVAVRIPQEVSA